jgi:hypothetical protein
VRVPDGATSYVAIGERAAAQGRGVLDCLGEGGTASDRVLPGEATLRRCLQATDPAALDAAVAGWAVGRLTAQQALAAGAKGGLVPADPGRRVIALDGKTLRGSAPRPSRSPPQPRVAGAPIWSPATTTPAASPSATSPARQGPARAARSRPPKSWPPRWMTAACWPSR